MKFVLCALCLVLSACAADFRIGAPAAKRALEVCEPFGGLEYIEEFYTTREAQTVEATCRDGSFVRFTVPRK